MVIEKIAYCMARRRIKKTYRVISWGQKLRRLPVDWYKLLKMPKCKVVKIIYFSGFKIPIENEPRRPVAWQQKLIWCILEQSVPTNPHFFNFVAILTCRAAAKGEIAMTMNKMSQKLLGLHTTSHREGKGRFCFAIVYECMYSLHTISYQWSVITLMRHLTM